MAGERRTVVIGLLGTRLDNTGKRRNRWNRWRPTVSLATLDGLPVDRIELLHDRQWERLARATADDIATVAPHTEVRLTPVDIDDVWDLEQVYAALFDFARSYPFDTEAEDYLVHITTGSHVAQICLFLLTESRHLPARLLQTSPGTSRDEDRYRLIDLDLTGYAPLKARFDAERDDDIARLKDGIDTRNPRFNALMDSIALVASTGRAPIHLGGPTGAGKSTLARRIWALKQARQKLRGAFVEINCATLRGDLAMSALFGHVRGAFTGAVSARQGALKAADGGVLFLDEVAELGMDEQTMLLRAIEEGRFSPVGSEAVVENRFQLITCTNRDLRERVAEGAFRADLLARIDVWSFELPGLRDRPEDIAPNLDVELERVSAEHRRSVTFSRAGRRAFEAWATSPDAAWPGNFRDLAAAVTRMATIAPRGLIDVAEVEEEIVRLRARTAPAAPTADDDLIRRWLGDAADAIDPFDRVQLAYVLDVCARSTSLAAAGRTLFAQSIAQRASRNDSDRVRKYLARFDVNGADVVGTALAR